MKKIIIFTALVIANGFSALAADLQALPANSATKVFSDLTKKDSEKSNSDKFQQLVDLALQSPTVSFDEVEGVYVGRCYDSQKRSTAINSGLLIVKIETQDNDGPIFGKENLVIEGGYTNEAANFLDSRTREDIFERLIHLKKSTLSVTTNPLSAVIGETNKSSVYEFHKYENYLIEVSKSVQDTDISTRSGSSFNVKANEIWTACYYFIKK